MTADFQLHPRLAADTVDLGSLALCRVLLMKDARYPWFILVPERPDVTEIFQLDADDRRQLIEESTQLSRCMMERFRPDKLNIGAIGNLVPQLHVHHVARYRSDAAWPNPVWGRLPSLPYGEGEAERLAAEMRGALGVAG